MSWRCVGDRTQNALGDDRKGEMKIMDAGGGKNCRDYLKGKGRGETSM